MKGNRSILFDAEYILKYVFVFIALLLAVVTFFVTHNLVNNLERDEQARVEVWANATRMLISADDECNISFAQDVIAHNNSIPVILVDSAYNVLSYRNLDSLLTDSQIKDLAIAFSSDVEPIEVVFSDDYKQYICYGKSSTLRQLEWFPFVQLFVFALFVVLLIVALLFFRRMEQNKVWAGLSKETAHQLGTPISSLMAWSEILKTKYPEDSMLEEMDKDVVRLRTIAQRFSQIGSKGELAMCDVNQILTQTTNYMSNRISKKVELIYHGTDSIYILANIPLFEWVIENLCKNAVDAMDGEGRIDVFLNANESGVIIDVSDTGKGISKKNLKYIFTPGFTTKKRGWGLGLSLARRIIEEYHNGKIYVLRSEIGVGTIFRIELRRAGL